MSENICDKCVFRQKIENSKYSKCKSYWEKKDFLGSYKTVWIQMTPTSFNFPFEYDPIWVKKCKKFEL